MSILSIPKHWLLMGNLSRAGGHLLKTVDGLPEHLAKCSSDCDCTDCTQVPIDECECAASDFATKTAIADWDYTITGTADFPDISPFDPPTTGEIDITGTFTISCDDVDTYIQWKFKETVGSLDYYWYAHHRFTMPRNASWNPGFGSVFYIGLVETGLHTVSTGFGNPYPTRTLHARDVGLINSLFYKRMYLTTTHDRVLHYFCVHAGACRAECDPIGSVRQCITGAIPYTATADSGNESVGIAVALS